ncbi:MAG TPA: thiamine-phosphate kinase [Chloroflexota bacterium]|nr:thiamine-phosphate kinase [Chloroflexota bacterium]
MSHAQTVRDLGEFRLIERLAGIVGAPGTALGIGDDAAVVPMPGPNDLLATTDTLVQEVHFTAGSDPYAVGRRALAVNVSDIAAMGGVPTYALVALSLDPDVPVTWVERLYEGLRYEGERCGVAIVGGNLSRAAGPPQVTLTQLGVVPRDQVVLRSGARIGDVLVTTGVLGRSSGLRRRGHEYVPEPRVTVARALAERHLVHAMLDLSDGLAGDLQHMAAASGVGAVVYEEAIPVAISAREAAADLHVDPRDIALFGGEDYELLMAIAPEQLAAATDVAGEIPLYSLGTILSREHGVVIERANGRRDPLENGWQHF